MSLPFIRVLSPACRFAGVVIACGFMATASPAREPGRTAAPAVLVTGKVQSVDSSHGLTLTQAVLEKLPQKTFTTHAPWTQAPQTYTGVLLRDLLTHWGATGTSIQASALNDYAITIPVDDARQFDVIVAYKIDGQPIPVRDRGPLLIMYPFDARPELQHRRYYERSIWQLKSLNVQ